MFYLSERSKNLFRQIKLSIVYKFLSLLFTFLLIRVLMDSLGQEKFGIWSAMYGIISWFLIMDIGISNGTRNKVAEAIHKDHWHLAKKYVSTSYVAIFVISSSIFICLYLFSGFINWQMIFNTQLVEEQTLKNAFLILSFFTLLNFTLAIVNSLYHAMQKTSYVVMSQFLSNFIVVIVIFILNLFFTIDLDYLALIYGLSIFLVSIFFNIYFFKLYIYLIPSIILYKHKLLKSTMNLGIKFFIIQIAALIIFTTDKIIILHFFGPEDVAKYEIIFKLFSLLTVVHGIIMTPMWSAFTEAYIKDDISWIKKTIFNLNKLMVVFIFLSILIVYYFNQIIILWIGKDMNISFSISILMSLYILLSIWSGIYANFLNGINQINVQMTTLILGAILNIPLSVFFINYYSLGIEGVILASILSLSLFAIIAPIQTYILLQRMQLNVYQKEKS